MYYNSNSKLTVLNEADNSKLKKIAKHLIHQVNMPQLGLYSNMRSDDIWRNLILQFCVVSGRRMAGDLRKDKKKLKEFGEKLNFRLLISKKDGRKDYMSRVLKEYKATSFYNKQAEKINDVLENSNVIYHNKIVLLNGIDHEKQNYKEIRDSLVNRVPHFKVKSASDFMIENGLSLNVIGLNTRIAEVLIHHFGLNVDNQKIQSSQKMYESIEDALRKAGIKMGVPLAYLSRMLYYYSEKDTISFILEDL